MKAATVALILTLTCTVESVKTRQALVLDEESSERPMTKLVNLLKDMQAKTETNAEADKDLYEKYKCFADKVIDDSANTIEEMTEAIATGKNKIEQLFALGNELEAKKAKLERDIKKNKASQTAAEAARASSKTEFESEQTDMEAGLQQLGQALKTLQAVGDVRSNPALLQLSENPALMAITHQLEQVTATNQKFLAAQANPGNTTSQSGGVIGILRSTKDTYAKNLKDLRQAEADSIKAHQGLMDTLKKENTNMNDQKTTAESDIAATASEKTQTEDKVKADTKTKEDAEVLKENTEKSLAAKTAVFEERKQLASEEITAISEAISVLNSDSSFDAFGKTSATGGFFLQLSATRSIASSQRQVLSFLRTEARKEKSERLARLAADLEKPKYNSDDENPFQEVLDEISEMQDVIRKESEADTKKKNWCIDERKTNNDDKTSQEAESLKQKKAITDYADELNKPESGLVATLDKAKADLIKNQEDQTEETKQRKAANQEYQTDISNLVTAIELMEKAQKTLKDYYAKISFVQAKESSADSEEADPDYDKGKYTGNEGGALRLIAKIIKDTEAEQTAAHKAEQEAQASFEDSMKSLTDSEKGLKTKINDTTKAIADTRKKMDEAEELKKDADEAIADIKKYLLDIKPGCDFIMANFDKREGHRTAESKALTGAVEKIKGTPAYKKFEDMLASRR